MGDDGSCAAADSQKRAEVKGAGSLSWRIVVLCTLIVLSVQLRLPHRLGIPVLLRDWTRDQSSLPGLDFSWENVSCWSHRAPKLKDTAYACVGGSGSEAKYSSNIQAKKCCSAGASAHLIDDGTMKLWLFLTH